MWGQTMAKTDDTPRRGRIYKVHRDGHVTKRNAAEPVVPPKANEQGEQKHDVSDDDPPRVYH